MKTFLLRLWAYVRPYRTRFILGSICGTVYGLTNGVFILAIKGVVDLIYSDTGKTHIHDQLAKAPAFLKPMANQLIQWIPELEAPATHGGWILLFSTIPTIMFFRVFLGYMSIYLTNWVAANAVADLRTKLFSHLQNMPLSFFGRTSTGELISRVSSDTGMLYQIIGNSFSSIFKDPVTILVLLCVQLALRPSLIIVSFIVMPVCIAPMIIFGRKVRKSAREIQGHTSDLTKLMHESFSGNRIVKAYNLEERVVTQFKATTRKFISHTMRVLRANEIPSQLMEFLAAVGVALVLIYFESQPKADRPTQGDFMMFIMSVVMLYPSVKALTRLHNQLHQAEAASSRVFELLETKSDIIEPAKPVALKARGSDIQFENIDFNYGEKPVLRGINLTVKAGQLVALVGSSGSGKTTMTNLLLRFYDPQRGAIRIGGTDIRQVATADLRSQIALVTQDTILFNDTIRNNIALGRPGATDAEIEAAAKAANAHEFIIQKPNSYDSGVGEKGVNVSGGQKQRISIARAILRDAPILVLDEATSALDTKSERIVQAELDKLMIGRTTICIAHRLSTIQKADVIIVMSEGRIVESGTHAELLQRGGVYQRLYELQFQT
ncbi:MAG: ABC transporter ATP-binding protein [Verrucomicrobiota bacterium]